MTKPTIHLNGTSGEALLEGYRTAMEAVGEAVRKLNNETHPNARDYYPQGNHAYQDAVKQVPENGEWWYRLGTLHLDKGSRDEARVALAEAVLRGDRLIEKPSWLADAHRHYGDVLRESGRVAEALENYRVFLELAPSSHADRGEIERIVRSGRR